MQFKVVIPSRYASTRLPGKPLLDIVGKPMVLHVVERAIESGAEQVVVATDDLRIKDVVEQSGHQVVMTSSDHQSGTDRIAEVAQMLDWSDDEVVVNVQGDEPLIAPAVILEVANKLMGDDEAAAATACFKISQVEDFLNPNVVKVVFNQKGHALYFSRAPIPYPRENAQDKASKQPLNIAAYQHIGLYAYRCRFLKQYAALPMVEMEQVEHLEQLRILSSGLEIAMHVVSARPEPGIDTQADLEKVRKILAK